MYFTREPLIETVMTPREGYKLVVRSTRNVESEEYFVDALEVVSFGQALFFRSTERPKCFLVPVSDYEVMEVRETRLILKAAPLEKGVKIGGGREGAIKSSKEYKEEKHEEEEVHAFEHAEEEEEALESDVSSQESPAVDSKLEKRRERRRHRRRKTKGDEKEEAIVSEVKMAAPVDDLGESYTNGAQEEVIEDVRPIKQPVDISMHFSSLIPPPPTLISETLNQYRNNENFKKAFVQSEENVEEESLKKDDVEKSEERFDQEESFPIETSYEQESHQEPPQLIEDSFFEPVDHEVIHEERIENIDTQRSILDEQKD
jgi:hypothetical protein